MKNIIKILLFALVTAGLSACATGKRETAFEATIRAYEQNLRWGDIERVNQFRKKPLVFSNVAKERFKNIKVTSYDIISIDNKTDLQNIVLVKMKYYHEQYARERTIEDKQEWNFDKATERWYISTPLPNF